MISTSSLINGVLVKSIIAQKIKNANEENPYTLQQSKLSKKMYLVPASGRSIEVSPLPYRYPSSIISFETFNDEPDINQIKMVVWTDSEGYIHVNRIKNVPRYVLAQAQIGDIFEEKKSSNKRYFSEQGIKIVPTGETPNTYCFSRAHSYFVEKNESSIPFQYLKTGEEND